MEIRKMIKERWKEGRKMIMEDGRNSSKPAPKAGRRRMGLRRQVKAASHRHTGEALRGMGNDAGLLDSDRLGRVQHLADRPQAPPQDSADSPLALRGLSPANPMLTLHGSCSDRSALLCLICIGRCTRSQRKSISLDFPLSLLRVATDWSCKVGLAVLIRYAIGHGCGFFVGMDPVGGKRVARYHRWFTRAGNE